MTTANRPGLPALAYRAGTHATFLETMKARLSNLYLEIPGESVIGERRRQLSRIYQLRDLKTREASDPAIALLDSWALVGDVLTFYQERIANEGYLRTATERRSVLELARLIGYTLRPGVASTVYPAYTLDEDRSVTPAKPTAVTIPKGSRIQSIPGPGELPQSFETFDELEARSEWNNLQVRLTKPQQITHTTQTVYFKGIATNLKLNDPLLIVASSPKLYRVMSVTPDPAADRTQVRIQPWLSSAGTNTLSGVRETLAFPEAVDEIVTRLSNVEPFGVVATSHSARQVLKPLEKLRAALTAGVPTADLKAMVEQDILPKLKEVSRTAVERRYTRIEPWVRSLMAELEAAVATESSPRPGLRASDHAASAPGSANATQKSTSLPAVLTSLGKAPSIPPPNSQRLPRSVEGSFAKETDLAPQLLTTFRPEAAEILYQAWRNVPVTPEPDVAVYALRTKAGVFGNNAPSLPTETFSIQLPPPIQTPGAVSLNIATIRIGKFNVRVDLRSLPATVDFPDAEETIAITLDGGDHVFEFQNRQVTVRFPKDDSAKPTATPTSKATAVKITKVASTPFRFVGGTISYDFTVAEVSNVVWLDAPYEQIIPDSWIVLERPGSAGLSRRLVISHAGQVTHASRSEYGISAKATQIALAKPEEDQWIDPATDTFAVIRGTNVFAQSEKLLLAEEPIKTPVCGGDLELQSLYDGLESGRWLIVSGERADIAPDQDEIGNANSAEAEDANTPTLQIKGVPASELVMLAGVEQTFDENLPGDRTHSRLLLAEPLAYCYKRDTMKIYGNVVKATHGETRNEVLGSGDGSKSMQAFTLKQSPLTFVSAAVPAGVESTLQVRINDVLWHEIDTLGGLGPTDRKFITSTDDDDKTTVIFGNGERGARLPTGQENVTAVYRNGIGKPGNVKAGQISLLVTRPLNVKEVINPLPATGGADRESRDQARENAPLAVTALDRLVSTQDYADFTRTFAGIGKATAQPLSDGQRPLVHVTIAGADDIPIDEHSDLFTNLRIALREFGDSLQAIQVEVRKLKLLVIQAKVRVLPDYLWEKVEPKVRAALLDKFSFARRALGQDALRSEAISAIQAVEGVQFVDVDIFDSVEEDQIVEQLAGTKALDLQNRERIPVELDRVDSQKRIRPAEIAYFSPDVTDTILLSEITQ
jgi:hypothetical protein